MTEEIIAKDLLDILVCPICKTEVQLVQYNTGEKEENGLQCSKCRKIYPIKDGIPVMLAGDAIDPDKPAEK